MVVRVFDSYRDAWKWAAEVAYARRVCNLRPLRLVRVSSGTGRFAWGVDNPDLDPETKARRAEYLERLDKQRSLLLAVKAERDRRFYVRINQRP